MAVNDILKVAHFNTFSPQTAVTVRHFRVSAEIAGGATYLEIANAIKARYDSLWPPIMPVNVTYRGVGVQRIKPLPRLVEVFSTAPTQAGTRTGDPCPSQTCGVITLRTALAGRKFRGRVYVPFPSEFDNNSIGRPTAAYVALLASIANELIASVTVVGALGTTTLVPVIYHKSTTLTDDVVSHRVRDIWGTQRRRGDFGQPNPPPV